MHIVAVHELAVGPSRHFMVARYLGRFRSEPDINRIYEYALVRFDSSSDELALRFVFGLIDFASG